MLVKAGPVVLDLDGVDGPDAVRLDGSRPPVAFDPAARRATVTVDLTRSTGFHQIGVGSTDYFFGTEDAKLRIDGMVQLLDYLGEHSLTWSGTMFFSGSEAVLRDPRLDWAWLQRVRPGLLEALTAIADRPRLASRRRHRRLDRGRPDVAATMRLLRGRPDLLEELEGGPIIGDRRSFAPREVITRSRTTSFDTSANRRATQLLLGARALASHVRFTAPRESRADVEGLLAALESLLLRHPFRDLASKAARPLPSSRPAIEEQNDPRYQAAHALHRELFEDRHWDPTQEVMPEWAYAGLADAIYQRFCAQLLADHFGLQSTALQPGIAPGPHFSNERLELYVDVTPPEEVIRDWREGSERPAALRPDILLRERRSGHVALLDAKYRAAGLRASPDSLTEVQLYLQAYGHSRVAVLFPPGAHDGPEHERWKIHRVTDGHFSIFEIPVLPEPRMADFLDKKVGPAIEKLI